MEGEKERENKKKGRVRQRAGEPQLLISDRSEICDMYIEHVCFSVSTCVYCVIFSYCERIDAVHANPAGETHSCKLKMFFSPRCFCAVQSFGIAHDSQDNTVRVMNVRLLTAYSCIKTFSTWTNDM